MIPYQIIKKKRDGETLTAEEIKSFVLRYTKGEIADYQMASFLMAVFIKGMNVSETAALTKVMVESGESCDFSDVDAVKVDKHSTGGLGDKTSFILAPIVASLGLVVPMISGRALGHTGGTLDKLESIDGIKVDLGLKEFSRIVRETGLAIGGQSQNLCPADKKMYALRDVTATVDCVPLITSSILCKKLAEGIDGLVMDIKVGSGAFMKSMKDASALTKSICSIGKNLGLKITAVISDMNQPLGFAVGNAIEIREVIDVLKGKGPKDTRDLSVLLAAHMVLIARRAKKIEEAIKLCESTLDDGSAFEKFKEMVKAQGGDADLLDKEEGIPLASKSFSFRAEKNGYIYSMNTEEIGLSIVDLGGGRKQSGEAIDHGVGLLFRRKLGEPVKAGDEVIKIYYEDENKLNIAVERLKAAIEISRKKPEKNKLIKKVVYA